jgi:hypothetical protein
MNAEMEFSLKQIHSIIIISHSDEFINLHIIKNIKSQQLKKLPAVISQFFRCYI